MTGTAMTFIAFATLTLAHNERWEIYFASTLIGLGIGLSFAALPNLIVAVVRQDQTGIATGMNTVMRTLGGAVGAQVAGSFLAAQLNAAGRPTEAAYTIGFAMAAGALLAGLLAGAAIPGRRRTAATKRSLVTA
jgi:MFS family permease